MILIEGNREALYQWDLNQRLVLTDIGLGNEVHFDNERVPDECCPVAPVYEQNGVMYADIPNVHLQSPGVLHVYAYVQEEDKSFTKHSLEILVIARKKPGNYVYTETEVMTWKKLEEKVNDAVEDLEALGEQMEDKPGEKSLGENSSLFGSSTNKLENLELPEKLYYKPIAKECFEEKITDKTFSDGVLFCSTNYGTYCGISSDGDIYYSSPTGFKVGDMCILTANRMIDDMESDEKVSVYVEIIEISDIQVEVDDEYGPCLISDGYVGLKPLSELPVQDDSSYVFYPAGYTLTLVNPHYKFENLTFTTDEADTPLEKLYTYTDKWGNKCYTVYKDYAPDIADGSTKDADGNPRRSTVEEVSADDEMLKGIKYEALFNTGTYFAVAEGDNSFSSGEDNVAYGDDSVSLGYRNIVLADGSTSLGRRMLVRGVGANGFGLKGKVTGRYATSFNEGGEAIGYASFVFGDHCGAYDYYGVAGGFYTKNYADTTFLYGRNCIAEKDVANSFGGGDKVHLYKGLDNFLWGKDLKCSGNYNSLVGINNTVKGHYNLVGGDSNTIGSSYNLVGGVNHTIEYNEEKALSGRNLISGLGHIIKAGWGLGVIGHYVTNIKGNTCLLAGNSVTNSGDNTVLLGNTINGNGEGNVLIGKEITAEKGFSVMLGRALHAVYSGCTLIGHYLKSTSYWQTIIGKYNAPSSSPFVVAYGTDDDNRKNIFEVNSKGETISTGAIAEYVVLKAPNGSKYKITVDNNGQLTTKGV